MSSPADYYGGSAVPPTAAYGPPRIDFTPLANGLDTFVKGRQEGREEDTATAFRNGIPMVKDANGNDTSNPNYNAMYQRLIELGAYDKAASLASNGIQLQQYSNSANLPPPPGGAPIAAPQPAMPAPQRGPAGPAANSGDRPGSIIGALTDAGIPTDQIGVIAGRLGSTLKIDPNNPMTPQQVAFVQSRLSGIKQSFASAERPSATGSQSAPVTAAQPDATPSQRISQGFADAGIPASGIPNGNAGSVPLPRRRPDGAPASQANTAPASAAVVDVSDTAKSLRIAPQAAAAFEQRLQATPMQAQKDYLNNLARSPQYTKSVNEWAEKRLESIERGEEPTNEQKNAGYDAASGGALTRHEAGLAGAKKAATAPFEIAEAAVREGGRPISIKPNEVVATGNQVNPALEGITNWAASRMGVPQGTPPRPGSSSSSPVSPTAAENTDPQNPMGRSAFTPQMVRNSDGSVASSVTPSTEVLQKTAATNYEKAREAFGGAQEVQSQLTSMEDSFRKLNASGWSSTGTGAEAKLQMAKAANSIWQTLGVKDQDLPFDPSTVSSWEKLTKDTTRLGFALARTLGAREAMQVVQGAINANPNVKNTPLGAKMVLNTIRQNAERQSDYFEYATQYAQTHGGDLIGAETSFSKLNPPTLYARRAIVQAQRDIPQEAIEQLRLDPKSAPAFDQHYGTKGLANMFLGQARIQGLQ